MRKLRINDIKAVKTPYLNKSHIKQQWMQIDASNLVVGRLAVYIANELRGKNTAQYTPHTPPLNKIVVTNTDKIAFTGKKMTDKVYYHHTGYVGGIKGTTAEKIRDKDSTQLLREAVRRMLPDNKLRKQFLRNLYIYKNESHKHSAQTPKVIKFEDIHSTHSVK